MNIKGNDFSNITNLRQKAEEKLEIEISEKPEASAVNSEQNTFENDNLRLIHELQVHQIELEMQNDELMIALDRAEAATALYDFAPAGYYTLDRELIITGLNIFGAELLGNERSSLINNNFNRFLSHDTLPVFNDFFMNILNTGIKQVCEVRFAIKDRPDKYVHIEGMMLDDQKYLLTAVDITNHIVNEKKIKKLLDEKELLLNEVHHRIKNNMYTIMNMLSMQSANEENLVIKSVLRDIISRVKVMEVLYNKLYCQEYTKDLSMKLYLVELVNEIVSVFPQRSSLKINTNIDDVVLRCSILTTIGIIVNELITNSMKYAFTNQDNCTISVTGSINNKRISLIYEDNGVGIPESVSIKNLTGFGLNLVNMLVEQIDGTIKAERGNEIKYIIEFDIE